LSLGERLVGDQELQSDLRAVAGIRPGTNKHCLNIREQN